MTERENVLRLFRGEMPEWLPESGTCLLCAGKLLMDIERPHNKEGYDWFGVHWLEQQAMGGVVTHPDVTHPYVLEDVTKWKEVIKFPDLEQIDWDAYKADLEKDFANLNGRMPFFMMEHGIWERLTLLMGFENALVALLVEPEACREYAEAMADFKIALFDKIIELAPFDMVLYQDDLGSTKGALMSLETYRDIFKEPVRRICQHVQSKGVLFGHHSCGRMEMFMDDLLDIGVDLVNPIQTWNNQSELKQKYGDKVVLYGGLNNQEITDILEPEENALRAELRRAVDTLAPGGRFILEVRRAVVSTNGVNAPAILMDEYEKYGRDFYSRNV